MQANQLKFQSKANKEQREQKNWLEKTRTA